jgi:hypothetical protein
MLARLHLREGSQRQPTGGACDAEDYSVEPDPCGHARTTIKKVITENGNCKLIAIFAYILAL